MTTATPARGSTGWPLEDDELRRIDREAHRSDEQIVLRPVEVLDEL